MEKNFISGRLCPEGGIESLIPRCQATSSTCRLVVFERLNYSLDLNIFIKIEGRGKPQHAHERMKFANVIMQDLL